VLPGQATLEVVAAYFAYKQLPREAGQSAAATEAMEIWEDEGGSTPSASHEPTR
jgi:hypothetical protein